MNWSIKGTKNITHTHIHTYFHVQKIDGMTNWYNRSPCKQQEGCWKPSCHAWENIYITWVPTIYKMEQRARLVIAHVDDIEDIIYFQDLEWVILNPN